MIATGISLALRRSDKLDKAAQVKTAKCISLHVEIVTVSRAETVLEKVRECTAVCIQCVLQDHQEAGGASHCGV